MLPFRRLVPVPDHKGHGLCARENQASVVGDGDSPVHGVRHGEDGGVLPLVLVEATSNAQVYGVCSTTPAKRKREQACTGSDTESLGDNISRQSHLLKTSQYYLVEAWHGLVAKAVQLARR